MSKQFVSRLTVESAKEISVLVYVCNFGEISHFLGKHQDNMSV